jgi:tetratricopeptide (TPR) repeat protein
VYKAHSQVAVQQQEPAVFSLLLAAALALQPSPSEPVTVEPPPTVEQVLEVPASLDKEFRARVLEATVLPERRLDKLIEFMFDEKALALKYRPDATHTIAESYQTRQVNCLSFTMMVVVLARRAGLQAYPQQIDRVLAWGLAGGIVMQSMHANAVVTASGQKYMLDVAVDRLSSPVADSRIDDEHLLALFYGNRAMELLVAGRLAEAKLWQNEALRHNQQDATLWNNAGVLRQRMGDAAGAEKMFLAAVEKNPSLASALSNLVMLYRTTGDERKEDLWRRRSERVLRRDPYYQFSQGQRCEQAGDYSKAISFYRRAISLHRNEHLFHFVLARAYYQSGRSRQASIELNIAKQLSSGADRHRYQSKLDALHSVSL